MFTVCRIAGVASVPSTSYPSIAATASARSPALFTSTSAVTDVSAPSGPAIRTAKPAPARSTAVTSCLSAIHAPFASAAAAYDAKSAAWSTTPVLPDHSAATHRTLGSSARNAAASRTMRISGTPFSAARCATPSSASNSVSSIAMISLPMRCARTPCSAAHSYSSRLPSRQSVCFSEPAG